MTNFGGLIYLGPCEQKSNVRIPFWYTHQWYPNPKALSKWLIQTQFRHFGQSDEISESQISVTVQMCVCHFDTYGTGSKPRPLGRTIFCATITHRFLHAPLGSTLHYFEVWGIDFYRGEVGQNIKQQSCWGKKRNKKIYWIGGYTPLLSGPPGAVFPGGGVHLGRGSTWGGIKKQRILKPKPENVEFFWLPKISQEST